MIIFLLLLGLVTSCSSQPSLLTSSFKTSKNTVKNTAKLYFLSPVAKLSRPRVSQGYRDQNNKRHEGVDFTGFRGAPIVASHSGRVVYAGRKFSGYGRVILIEYNKKWASLYAHLNSFSVKTGQRVRPGQVIGSMGSSGRATGVHLHFELLRFRQPVDPSAYLVFHSNVAKR